MHSAKLTDFSKLAIHTMTNKPWSLDECISNYNRAGVAGITVWRNVIAQTGLAEAVKMLKDSELEVVAHVRGGFFPAQKSEDRQKAHSDNLTCIDEAAAIGAPMVVLVCGAVAGMPLKTSREQITSGIEAILPHAEANKIKLAIEPLHPMYAANRSAINTMGQARAVCEKLQSKYLGIAVDVYHTWWDPELEQEIKLSGEQGTLFAFHICDWRTDTRNLLTDRGIMGEGCIDIPLIRSWIEEAGFNGYNEVEIFSTDRWSENQRDYVETIKEAYLNNS